MHSHRVFTSATPEMKFIMNRIDLWHIMCIWTSGSTQSVRHDTFLHSWSQSGSRLHGAVTVSDKKQFLYQPHFSVDNEAGVRNRNILKRFFENSVLALKNRTSVCGQFISNRVTVCLIPLEERLFAFTRLDSCSSISLHRNAFLFLSLSPDFKSTQSRLTLQIILVFLSNMLLVSIESVWVYV